MTSLYVLQRQPMGFAKTKDTGKNLGYGNLAPYKQIRQINLPYHGFPNAEELRELVLKVAISDGGSCPTTYYVRATGKGIRGSASIGRFELSAEDIREFLERLHEGRVECHKAEEKGKELDFIAGTC